MCRGLARHLVSDKAPMIGERTRGCTFSNPAADTSWVVRGGPLPCLGPVHRGESRATSKDRAANLTDGPTFGTAHGWVRGHGNVQPRCHGYEEERPAWRRFS